MLDVYVVGNVIRRFREERNKSQELVSGLAGIGRTHLSAIERGERKPTLETFFRISSGQRNSRCGSMDRRTVPFDHGFHPANHPGPGTERK